MLVVLIIAAVMTNAPAAAAAETAPKLTSPPMWLAELCIYNGSCSVIYYACVCGCRSASVECVAYAALLIFIFARFTRALLHLFALSLTAVATHIFFSALFWALSVAFNWYTCFFARQRNASVCEHECLYPCDVMNTHTHTYSLNLTHVNHAQRPFMRLCT